MKARHLAFTSLAIISMSLPSPANSECFRCQYNTGSGVYDCMPTLGNGGVTCIYVGGGNCQVLGDCHGDEIDGAGGRLGGGKEPRPVITALARVSAARPAATNYSRDAAVQFVRALFSVTLRFQSYR